MSFQKTARLPLRRIAAIAALVLLAASPARAAAGEAAAAAPPAPRIGLALSGGGARGLAHIGVLKVLEEFRVPVHCVTGTSMGAVVGGSFASGVGPARLEEIVRNTNWGAQFTDRPPRAEISTRRKVDDYKTLFAPEYGLKDGKLALPKGLLAGVTIESFIRTLTHDARGVDDFSRLPVPYRAVAADIESGDAVILSRGSVAQAMRASMSIPGVMSPVVIDGRLLVDGGIANNLPIDEARKLCGDVVIAVDISTPPLKREDLTSALTVSVQLLNLLGKTTVEQQLKNMTERDVLIKPVLGDISSSSFDRAVDAVAVGEKAAREMEAKLRRYSVSPEAYAALRAKQTPETTALGSVDEIRFEGLQRTNPEVLRSLMQTKTGEPLSEEKIAQDLRRIYGRGDFEGIDYHILQEPGRRVMVVQPREKDWGPNYLRFGLGLASDFKGESQFNALVSYRRTWMNKLGGEWLIEGQVGQDSHLFTEFYQPVEARGRFFVAPYALARRTSRGVFVGPTRFAEYDTDEGRVGIDGGMVLSTALELRIGPQWRRIDASVDTGSPVLPALKETSAGGRFLATSDHYDSPFFPRHGHRAAISAYVADRALGSDRNYERLETSLSIARSWGRHTFNAAFYGGTDFNSGLPAYETFTLGGPLRLSGYRIGEFTGRQMAFGRLMYYNRTLPLPDILGSGVYAGASLEAGRMKHRFDGFPDGGTLVSGSVFLGAETFLGPGYFGVGAGEAGRWSLYLLLGVP